MTHQAIITRWQASTPQERDLWVRRVVFPELGEKPSDYHEHMKCPACGYDAHWEMDWRGDCQPYTQHPAAAWLVVERMRENGYAWRAHHEVGKQVAWLFDGTASGIPIQTDDSAVGTFDAAGLLVALPSYPWAYCDTEAEAICLAALLALDRLDQDS